MVIIHSFWYVNIFTRRVLKLKYSRQNKHVTLLQKKYIILAKIVVNYESWFAMLLEE